MTRSLRIGRLTGLRRPRFAFAAGIAAFCILSAGVPCLARPPAQPNGPAVPSRGSGGSLGALPLDVIPWKAYAAAAVVIIGGTALFAFVTLRREASEERELMGQAEIDLLAQHAEAFAVLYENYCKQFRAQRPLWESLAADERKHSRWIGGFAARLRGGEGKLRRELFPYGRVANAVDQLRQLAGAAAGPDLTEGTALRNALLQENDRAEWRLPELFTVSSAKFGTTLELLQSEAQAHQRALAAAIEQG